MDANSLKSKLTSATAWLRRQPRAVLFPAALLIGIVVMTAIASLHSTSTPQASAKPEPDVQQPAQPPAPQAPAQPPARAPSAVVAIPKLPSATTPATDAKAPAAAAALAPPAGLRRGYVQVSSLQQDQFDRWTQVSTSVKSAQTTSHTATSSRSPARLEWSAWVHLQQPATLAELEVGGEAGGRVSAQIDGASFGDAIQHYYAGRARSRIASISLAAGWHRIEVTVALDASGTPMKLATRIAFGDGTTPPAPGAPWAVPNNADAPAAPALAPSAEPDSTNAAPAAASTATQGAQS